MMQSSTHATSEIPYRLPNPALDFAVAGIETLLKAWQAYHVEGTLFVARRMRSNLEQLRALGHCCDVPSATAHQLQWLREIQKDYAEEWGRLAATSFTLATSEWCGLGSFFRQRMAKEGSTEAQVDRQARGKPKNLSVAA